MWYQVVERLPPHAACTSAAAKEAKLDRTEVRRDALYRQEVHIDYRHEVQELYRADASNATKLLRELTRGVVNNC